VTDGSVELDDAQEQADTVPAAAAIEPVSSSFLRLRRWFQMTAEISGPTCFRLLNQHAPAMCFANSGRIPLQPRAPRNAGRCSFRA
jgi:hypothetical protein